MIDTPLRLRLAVAAFCLTGITTAFIGFYFPREFVALEDTWAARRATLATQLVKGQLDDSLQRGDPVQVRDELRHAVDQPEIRVAALLDAKGLVQAIEPVDEHVQLPALPGMIPVVWEADNALWASVRLHPTNVDTPILAVGFELDEREADASREQSAVVVISSVTLIIGIIGSALVASVLTKPIRDLTAAATNVIRGQDALQELARFKGAALSQDEIRRLTYAIAVMAERLDTQVKTAQGASQRAQRAEAAARQASRAKSAFLANMSHELRTPLNAIIGYAQLIREDTEEPQIRQDLDKILRASQHLLSLISDVLDLAKIEAGRMEAHWEHVDLESAFRDVVNAAAPLASNGGNELRVEHGTLGVITSDTLKIRQILLNLLSNACKFTCKGTVSFTSTLIDGKLTMVISDTGIGMSPEQLARIFQPFVQADSSTTRTYGGTGLGLSITRSFVELLEGTIEVTSEPGKGSRFTVVIPDLPNRMRDDTSDDGSPTSAGPTDA